MSIKLYNPFKTLAFDTHTCFLSGEETSENITVFPEWLMNRFHFEDDAFEMMDKVNKLSYKDLKMPCSPKVKEAIRTLDEKIKKAFENGFEAVSALDSLSCFQWIGRIVYGVLYHELSLEKERLKKYDKPLELSPLLKDKYGNFHLMLQSLITPITFGERKPWSIILFRMKYSADIFSYRDDAVNLMFQLGINGFGLVACLQDNGVLLEKNKEVVEKIKGHILHPVQFEELYARFHYSDYILQYQPEYEITVEENQIHITALPVVANENRPLFGHWDNDMFAQVLTNYWQVYGIEKKDILHFQKPPISFLENPYTQDFILPEKITLPF